MQKNRNTEGFDIDRNRAVVLRSTQDLAESNGATGREASVLPSACATVVQMFEAQARATPDVPAIVFRDRQWTFRELNRRANQLAHHLRCFGVMADVPVGICLDRSLEMTTAVLGILKAGGACVPLDPAYPVQRLAYMTADALAAVVLTRTGLRDRLPDGPISLVCIDTDADRIAEHPTGDPRPAAPIERLAYVIYTSGSTGQPKGIAMGRPALANLIRWQVNNSPLRAFGRNEENGLFSGISVHYFRTLLSG